MINIVLFGPPGAGKGTQALKLTQKYGFDHISTGEIIRDEITAGTEAGLQVQDRIARGELAPDEMVLGMIEHYLEEHEDSNGNIFDGFPRTKIQARRFDEILDSHGYKVDVMFSLDVPDEILISRMLKRGAEGSGRADDVTLDVIKRRIEVYKAQTAIVANHYANHRKYFAIDGTKSVDEVFDRICKVIDSML